MEKESARLLNLKKRIAETFTSSDWTELGLTIDCEDIIDNHGRLLRALRFGDDDYSGCVLEVLKRIKRRGEEKGTDKLKEVEDFLNIRDDPEATFVSSTSAGMRLVVVPTVFQLSDKPEVENDLVSVMMPFDASFSDVYKAIQLACTDAGLRCDRADNVWDHPVVVQDIFSLILRSRFVVVDFSKKNPNVFYETGIAHTLGKEVIPLSQSIEDVPFDLRHHRVLTYLNNSEGLATMRAKLSTRLMSLAQQ